LECMNIIPLYIYTHAAVKWGGVGDKEVTRV